MAAGNIARIMRVPGRLVVNPTTAFATTAYPYGGTEVGKSNLCVVQPLSVPVRVECEALGEATDVLEPAKSYRFACFLRGWDDDAVKLLMGRGYVAGATSQHAFFEEPGNKIPGESALDRGVVLAYVPDNVLQTNGLVIYRGIPDWTEGSEMLFQRNSELGLPLTVDCLRDSNDNILRIGRMADLLLT